MDRSPQFDAGGQVVDPRFFAEHPDALIYVRWATVAECEVQRLPAGTVVIVKRRSPIDQYYLRVWCRSEPSRPICETFAVFAQLPQFAALYRDLCLADSDQ